MNKNTSPSESAIIDLEPLDFQWPTADPFLFCVHHLDRYPKSNGGFGPDASLSGRMIGQDFQGKDGWRMYHGEKIPGFPGHPHRGFETVTIVERGFVDHADSLGAAGRYANGDVQWMTAGAGIMHSEMFPLLDKNPDNTLELFQIWLNLPAKNKMVDPHFTMHWNEKIPVLNLTDESGARVKLKIVSGVYNHTKALSPPPDSWASHEDHHVWIWILNLEPEAEFEIPASEGGLNRNLYYYKGEGLQISNKQIPSYQRVGLKSDEAVNLKNGNEESRLLLLQGKPIAEPVVQYGPFVMNSQEEIQKTFSDYQQTGFGGWPWHSADPVHDKSERFARHSDGRKETPESA